MFILSLPIQIMNKIQMKISIDFAKAINYRTSRILSYQSAKKLFEVAQTA